MRADWLVLRCRSYGPREVKRREDFSMKGQLMCELKFATFACRQRKGHQPDQKDKSYSLIVQEALEPAVLLVSPGPATSISTVHCLSHKFTVTVHSSQFTVHSSQFIS